MKKFVFILTFFFTCGILSAQGFPDAQKQPKQKEMKTQHKKFARQAKRHHRKRGTRSASHITELVTPYMAAKAYKRRGLAEFSI